MDTYRPSQRSEKLNQKRLVTAEGSILGDPMQSLQAAGLQDGDQLTAIMGQTKLASTQGAFAAWCCGGDGVVTWGDPRFGGKNSAVHDQLRSVQQVQATSRAFAAILEEDGCVVAWGDLRFGGDSSAVQDQLRRVQQIHASPSAFAAILENGSVVTWGHPPAGGDSSAVQDQLRNVKQVQAANGASAAILEDGSVVTWGYPGPCDTSAVQDQLKTVQYIQATGTAFAAILEDGSVVAWGEPDCGGDSSAVQDQLRSVQQLHASGAAFAAILEDGSVVTWGYPESGGDSSAVQDQLRNVKHIEATWDSFAAILENGSVVTWGYPKSGGDSSAVQDQLRGVQYIQATRSAFAAILEDGSVVTWGEPDCGGDSSAVQDQLKSVQQLHASGGAFAAILEDGSVVTWGEPDCGGDSSAIQDELKEVYPPIGLVLRAPCTAERLCGDPCLRPICLDFSQASSFLPSSSCISLDFIQLPPGPLQPAQLLAPDRSTGWPGIWMSNSPGDHDVVELDIAFQGLQISVRGPADTAARFVHQVASGSLGSGPPSLAASTQPAYPGQNQTVPPSPSRQSQASSVGSETRASIEGSFPACPQSWIVAANTRLRGSSLSATDRARRAWLAGCWARAVLDRRVGTGNKTPTIDLRNGFWVVLRCDNCQVPRIFTSSAAYFRAIGTLEGSDTVSQAFPSETEARIYLSAAGLEVLEFN
eukprot:s1300_g17.t1